MSSQRGEASAKILLLLLVCAIFGAIASPWLLRSRRSTAEEKAIATLQRIHSAQTDYFGGTRLYASMAKLSNTKLFDGPGSDVPFERDGYEFTHSNAAGWQRWCAQAVPKAAPLKLEAGTFAIDESGIVKEFPAGSSPCYAGELQSPGTPVR